MILSDFRAAHPALAADSIDAAIRFVTSLLEGATGQPLAADVRELAQGIAIDSIQVALLPESETRESLEASLDNAIQGVLGMLEIRAEDARSQLLRDALRLFRLHVLPVVVKAILATVLAL